MKGFGKGFAKGSFKGSCKSPSGPSPGDAPQVNWMDQTPDERASSASAWEHVGPRGQAHVDTPPDFKYTALGLLKRSNHWNFAYYEFAILQFIHMNLTTLWPRLQGGTSQEDLELWQRIFVVLEFDRKAQIDLMLLVHSGECGRAEANEILWTILSVWALKPDYQDLSNKVSPLVRDARRAFDRPPRKHEDYWKWHWALGWQPRHPHWSPLAVPRDATLHTGPAGLPLAPPACWGPPLRQPPAGPDGPQ